MMPLTRASEAETKNDFCLSEDQVDSLGAFRTDCQIWKEDAILYKSEFEKLSEKKYTPPTFGDTKVLAGISITAFLLGLFLGANK